MLNTNPTIRIPHEYKWKNVEQELRSATYLNDDIRVGSIGQRRRGLREVEAEVEQEREHERRSGHCQKQREEPGLLPEGQGLLLLRPGVHLAAAPNPLAGEGAGEAGGRTSRRIRLVVGGGGAAAGQTLGRLGRRRRHRGGVVRGLEEAVAGSFWKVRSGAQFNGLWGLGRCELGRGRRVLRV